VNVAIPSHRKFLLNRSDWRYPGIQSLGKLKQIWFLLCQMKLKKRYVLLFGLVGLVVLRAE
jgi:hypothetical protein